MEKQPEQKEGGKKVEPADPRTLLDWDGNELPNNAKKKATAEILRTERTLRIIEIDKMMADNRESQKALQKMINAATGVEEIGALVAQLNATKQEFHKLVVERASLEKAENPNAAPAQDLLNW